jgi:xanthine dehydrogenase YagS FAD-binding subunit
MLRSFNYVRATSLEEAISHLAKPGARIHAGGTDLIGCLRDGVFQADKLVSISRLDSLRGMGGSADGGLRIGALTSISEIAADRTVVQRYAALAQGAAAAASPQLRNQGTIGGNICQRPRCWYYRADYECVRKGGDACYAMEGGNQNHCIFGGSTCYIVHPSDTAPALVALGARAVVVGPAGRRIVPLEEFFLLPSDNLEKENVLAADELVTEILLPPPSANTRSSYRKVRARGSWDFAIASVALAVAFKADRVEAARIVLGAAAPIPWRCQAAERVIVGNRLDARTVSKAAAVAMEGAEPLSENEYKIPLFRGLIEEALLALAVG